MNVRLVLAIPLVALLAACDQGSDMSTNQSTMPLAPSRMDVKQAAADVLVKMFDACDPETFNAKSISCIRAGGVTFDQFIAQLTRFGFIGPWRFAPVVAHVHVGETFAATNIGGEVHTFTRVANFGGGIVPLLNDLAHVPTVAPECAPPALGADDFVQPGGTYRERIDRAGDLRFQCCIHPWMRLEASSGDPGAPESR
jgi:hypothetical protein